MRPKPKLIVTFGLLTDGTSDTDSTHLVSAQKICGKFVLGQGVAMGAILNVCDLSHNAVIVRNPRKEFCDKCVECLFATPLTAPQQMHVALYSQLSGL
ncbi:MAG: hypothetical protein GX811_10770 [Lentisphaerae bacterium]|nr:hypothetical protein [Lentisphaerota bacterium]